MRILVIGAAGDCGRRLVHEALGRGHTVTRAGRTPGDGPGRITLDAADASAVSAAAARHDVVLSATRPDPGHEADVAPVTRGLASGTRLAGRRLVVVGGAGPLRVPGNGRTAIEDPRWVPPAHRAAAEASLRQLGILQDSSDLDWTYLAPAAQFGPGERTGRYRTDGDRLVVDADGTSSISMEDFAVAALDEIERPATHRAILSVGSRNRLDVPGASRHNITHK